MKNKIINTQILSVKDSYSDEESIKKAAILLRKGGIVAFPTETFYGLGANACDKQAVEKIFKIKKRTFKKPVLILISSVEMLKTVAEDIPEKSKILIEKFWPGPLTIIFNASECIPDIITAYTGKIGVRISSHPVAKRLVEIAGVPVTAPSANISGQNSISDPGEIIRIFKGRIDAIINAGITPGGMPSTVIDMTSSPPDIIRPGAISLDSLRPYF